MSCTQPPIYSPGLPINITTLIAPQKQRHPRHLIRMRTPSQGVQLPNLALRPPLPRRVIHGRRHPRLNNPRTQRVDTHPGPRKLERHGLRNRNHPGLGGRVVGGPGVGPEARHRGSPNDAPARVLFLRRRHLHGRRGVLGSQEHGERVRLHGAQECLGLDLGEELGGADDACVGEEDVETPVGGEGVINDRLYARGIRSVELARVDVDGRVQGQDFALVRLQMGVSEVAEVDGPGPVLGELVSGSAANAERAVGTCLGVSEEAP